jgi:hypothetical protein
MAAVTKTRKSEKVTKDGSEAAKKKKTATKKSDTSKGKGKGKGKKKTKEPDPETCMICSIPLTPDSYGPQRADNNETRAKYGPDQTLHCSAHSHPSTTAAYPNGSKTSPAHAEQTPPTASSAENKTPQSASPKVPRATSARSPAPSGIAYSSCRGRFCWRMMKEQGLICLWWRGLGIRIRLGRRWWRRLVFGRILI